MPSYVKNERVIFASEHAYKTIYQEQGYLPVEQDIIAPASTEEPPMDLGEEATPEHDPEKTPEEDPEDDYSDEEEDEVGAGLDPNEAMPLAARVGLLSYQELKAQAKALGIPKYANTKHEDLIGLVVDALEAQHDNQ